MYGYQPLLAIYGSQAELTVLTNPNAAYVSAGQFGEVLAEEFVTRTGTRVGGTTQFDRLNALTRAGVLVGWSRDAQSALIEFTAIARSLGGRSMFRRPRSSRSGLREPGDGRSRGSGGLGEPPDRPVT
ncbi:hypothetical protein [Streptomyces canus]|uniref:hypothetical protein n=1 Tax=Streptomyces canus TaxID=58343 RepID=UPI002E2FC0E6|nr:hypothetical protein [Streptomyces canus]